MPAHKKHHFIPQFYFRKFSNDGRTINLLLLNSSEIKFNAPIKNQAQRRKFYLTTEIEKHLSRFESAQAEAITASIKFAEAGDSGLVDDPNARDLLLHTALVQRARTPHEGELFSAASCEMMLKMFRAHVKESQKGKLRESMLSAIDSGQCKVAWDSRESTLLALSFALEAVPLIRDLSATLLLNQTNVPFIFSDWPVVFFNQYYERVTDRGVLGLQTPGLQIFMPVNPRVCLMLVDADVYSGSFHEYGVVPLYDIPDISYLNAMQVHQAKHAIYFGDASDAEYVADITNLHRKLVDTRRVGLRIYHRIDKGVKADDPEFFQHFEPQLNLSPGFSFIHCDPIDPREYRWRHRNPELAAEHKNLYDNEDLSTQPDQDEQTEPVLMEDSYGRRLVIDLPRFGTAS